jgi:endoglucanase
LIQQNDFTLIKNAGFKTVRIPIRWTDHAAIVNPYTIDAAFLSRVKQVVDWALAAGLNVVINDHHYIEMMNESSANLPGHKARLHAIWSQICDQFTSANYSSTRVVFELLNEPNGTVTYAEWNNIISDLTTLIWTTKGQSDRKIMIGTANWGGVPGLTNLVLPAACTSANTIITIHYYEPFHFTHQGAEWVDGADAWKGTLWTGSASDQAPLLSLLNDVVTWNSQSSRGFEIFMGEFGVYTKYADQKCQQAWTAFISREAENRKMSWAYWEFCQGFGAFDPAAGSWKTQLLDALIPVSDRP